jgi:hypothetical protein
MNHKTSSYKHPVKENIDMEYLLPQKLSSGKVFSHIFTVLLALSVIENGLLSTGILSTTLPITQLPRKGYIPAVKDTYMRRSEASSSSCPISRKSCNVNQYCPVWPEEGYKRTTTIRHMPYMVVATPRPKTAM